MRSASAIVALLIATAGSVGCSALEPYPDTPQPAASGVKDAGPRVAICYDFVVSSGSEVQKTAQDQCGPHTLAARVETDWKLDFCPLLLPARATFVCKPVK